MTTNGSPLPTDGLLAAFRCVLRPLARLAVASGLSYARIEEVLRQVLVEAASDAHSALPPERRVSRISTTLGLNRREVTRLHRAGADQPPAPASHATRLFLRWQSDVRFRGTRGALRSLPRQGPGLTFEQLAQEITRDVHPRSLLEELSRLGLVHHDAEKDMVELIVDAFVPRGDKGRMLGFLGANVGDHLEAAVSNVLGTGSEHFEQAIFADELSVESIRAFRETITRQWQALRSATVPALETLIEVDRAVGRAQDQRLRVGLFSFTEPMPAPVPVSSEPPRSASAGRKSGPARKTGTPRKPGVAVKRSSAGKRGGGSAASGPGSRRSIKIRTRDLG
jgi:hypothetical protein